MEGTLNKIACGVEKSGIAISDLNVDILSVLSNKIDYLDPALEAESGKLISIKENAEKPADE